MGMKMIRAIILYVCLGLMVGCVATSQNVQHVSETPPEQLAQETLSAGQWDEAKRSFWKFFDRAVQAADAWYWLDH